MHAAGLLLFAFVFTLSFVGLPLDASAEILSTGDDTERVAAPPVVQSVDTTCRILWFRRGGNDNEIERLRMLGYDLTVVDSAPFLALDVLLEYGTVVIAYTGPGIVASRQPDLQAFVDLGGGLFIHQPNHEGALDYAPLGFDVTITDPVWCAQDSYFAEIVDASHPITAGCADADLSGAFDSVGTLGPGFHVLTGATDCAYPALAAGSSGLGRIAFDTGNGSLECVVPGTELYWDNLYSWLCTPGPIAAKPTTWAMVKAGYR